MRNKGYLATLLAAAVVCGAVSGTAQAQSAGSVLDKIKERDALQCSAHNGSYAGFFEIDSNGNWKGFDIQFCKALAAAILGSADKVTYVPLSWAQRFLEIQSGHVDVLFKATGWTLSRDATQGVDFSMPYFYGGFQFMVPASLGVETAQDLDGATVCTGSGTSLEPILADYMAAEGISMKIVTFQRSEETIAAYTSGRCDVYAAWGPNLAVTRATKLDNPADHTILPINLSLEPIAAAMLADQKDFRLVVNWVIAAMITAEQLKITSENVDEIKAKVEADSSVNPVAARLLGVDGNYGEMLKLPASWAYDVIKQVGNYGEVYSRTLGDESLYGLDRGLNNLWNQGGLISAPVFD